jgi:hypothetical protein
VIFENLVHFIGALLKHIIGVLLLCWRRMLRAGVIAFLIGAVVTALVAVLGTGQVFPGFSAAIVALLFGLALAYGVALTVLIEELILGAIDLIRMLEGDLSAAAHITEVVAEREVGEVGHGLRRLIGLPVSQRRPARPGATLPPLSRPNTGRVVEATAVASATALATGTAITATRAAPTTPEPRTQAGLAPTGEPVPADRLPRITWTYEHEAIRPSAPTAQSAATTPPPASEKPPASALTAAPSEPVAAPSDSVAAEPGLTAEQEESFVEQEPITPPTGMSSPDDDAWSAVSETAGEEPASASPFHLAQGALGVAAQVAGGLVVSHLMDALSHHGVGAGPAAPQEAEYEDERLAAPDSVTTPGGPSEPAERADDSAEEESQEESTTPAANAAPAPSETLATEALVPTAVPAPATTPLSTKPADQRAPSGDLPAADEPVAGEEPPMNNRVDGGRRTLPLGGADAALHTNPSGTPRANAPESGLWERLSSALINRSGAPSGPFAPAPSISDEPGDEPSGDEPSGEQSSQEH